MAQLKYCDKHNQVGFLPKPDESAGFTEILDFLRGSNLRYALTTNPTIYDSLVKQFWQTATAKTLADGTLELHATIDTIVYIITEASIRNKLQLADASGITIGVPKPLLPAMLSVVDPSAGQEAPPVTQPQPSSSVVPPTPSITQPIPSEATTIPPLSQPAPPTPIAETTTASPSPSPSPAHEPMEHTFEQPSTDQQPPTPRQEATTSQLMARIDDLEKQLKETKQTFGKAILTLVERVKSLEVALKRKTKRVLLSDSEEEETEAQGRKTHDLDPLVSLVQELITPSKTVNASGEEQVEDISPITLQELITPSKTINASGEEQVEDISPTTLEAAAILTKVKKIKSVDKGKRYKRRKSSKEFAGTGLDFEEVKSAFEEVNTGGIKVSSGIEEINAGSLDVNTGIDPVTTDSIRVSVPSPDRGRREGKAPMTEEEETQASRKTKEQILQEEAGLAEAIRLDALEKALEKEEVAKQVHLDSLIAQRMAEEKELTEEQNKRKAQVQFEAQSYTEEDWDTIRANLEVNSELKESVLGKDLTNQGTWKLTQLKKLNFEEVKAEFEKLVKQLDTYVPMNFEATKESLKRFGEELQTKTAKKLKFDDEGTQPTEEKVEEDKDDEPTKKTGKRRKQIARKGFHTHHDKDESEDSDEANEKDDSTSGTKIPINPVLVATKSPSIANYKIIKQGRKGVYQIVRENGTDMVYISFGAMLTDISRDDLTELYRIVMRKHGMNEPEDEFEKVLWEYLKNIVHCLNLESVDVYMLIERKYPLSAEVCKAMLDKKLQGGKPDEDCYKLLKMMEKQAGAKGLTSPEQMATGKGISNPFMAIKCTKFKTGSTKLVLVISQAWKETMATESVVENPIEYEDETVPVSVYEVGESSTAAIPREDGDRLLHGFMRRDIDSLFGRMVNFQDECVSPRWTYSWTEKKSEAKEKFYGKLILELGNEVVLWDKVTAAMERIMPPKPAPMTQAAMRRMIKESVDAAIAVERERQAKVRNDASGSGPVRGQNNAPAVRECTFAGFTKCNPTVFRGIKVAIKLRRWFEKTKSVFGISKCAEGKKVKEYDIVAYTQRFNELALMCPRMVEPERVKVDAYIRGLTDNIKGEVTSSKPA
ncbi:hypothetical protein Tco_0795862, partial [Tanacetum coccineum]